jgi:PKD repeat protein
MRRLAGVFAKVDRSSKDVQWRRFVGAVWVTLMLIGVTAGSAGGATTLPVLWTAGGLSAGADAAGNSARMAIDASGNVAVVSGGFYRMLVVTSYTSAGVLRWQRTVAPSSGTFAGDWVVAAPNGDLVAIGHNQDSHGRPIASTMVRYASDGTLLWRVDFSSGFYPQAGRILVDAAGNAFIAWSAVGSGLFVQKYSPSGALLWSQADSTGSGYAVATSLALSPDGVDVVATGDVAGGATWITAAYDATTGVSKWHVAGAEGIAALDVVVDATRVYVTGQGNVGSNGFLTVVAYDRATGARLWRTDANPPTCCAIGQRIALAPDGSLVVAGHTATGGYFDWWIVAMNTNGAVRWQALRNAAVSGDELPAAVFVLADGTTVVSGTGGPVTRDILGNSYMQGVTAGYSPGGTPLWEGFSKLPTVWAAPLPSGDVCATGGYDALIACFRVAAPASPPVAPSGLTARLATGSIVLTWQDNATDETAYSVERSEYTGTGWTDFVALATLQANATSYSDNQYTTRSYNYRVHASNAGGFSAYSNTAGITIIGVITVPTAVMSATPSSGTAPLAVTFDGSGSTDIEGFLTSWAWAFGDGTFGTGVTATHVYSTPGTYTATLTVTDTGNKSDTATASIVVNAPALPSAPASLTAAALSRSSIGLSWTNGTSSQTEVRVERCRGNGCTNFAQIAAVAGTATTFTDTGLASRTTYTYRVRAHNAAGDSTYSNTAGARTPR